MRRPTLVSWPALCEFPLEFLRVSNTYLDNRAGILAQAAPNIGPIMYDEILGGDGIVRTLQWTSRVEPSLELEDKCKYNEHGQSERSLGLTGV